MASDPDLAEQLARVMRDLYANAEQELAGLIARRLAVGIDAPAWAIRQLNAVNEIGRDTGRLLRALETEGNKTLRQILLRAYAKGASLAGADLAAVGQPIQSAFGGVDRQAMLAFVSATMGGVPQLGPAVLRIASEAEEGYRRVIHEVVGQELTGTHTRRGAVARAMGLWARDGVSKFTDKAGRRWDLASFAEMATRTVANRAMLQGHVARLQNTGHDLVMVSDAPEECKLCRPWEGKVLTLGRSPIGRQRIGKTWVVVAGSLRQAERAGLFHPNCRHRTVVYVPGRTAALHDTADPEGDRLRQQQRAKERRVRELKRELAAIEELGDTPERASARSKLRAYSAEFKSWREANDRKNLNYRTQLKTR